MARNRDNRPELDYDLLVERHERFRSRHPQKKSEKPSDSASPKVKPDLDKAQSSAKAQPVQPSAPEADEAQNAPEAADVAAPVDAPIPDDLDGAVAEAPDYPRHGGTRPSLGNADRQIPEHSETDA